MENAHVGGAWSTDCSIRFLRACIWSIAASSFGAGLLPAHVLLMNGGPPPAAARTRSSAPHGIPPTNQIKVELTNNTPGRPTARPARPPPARRPSRPARPAGRPAGPELDRPSLCFWLGLFLARERFCLVRGWYPAHRGRAASQVHHDVFACRKNVGGSQQGT